MLDFKELSVDGNDFELLIRELLFEKGLDVYWSGKGPDGGKDLLCVETLDSIITPNKRTWLVQCKHTAHSGKAVGIKDLDDIVVSCSQHNADGYLLVCSTYPSSALVDRLNGINNNNNNKRYEVTTQYWDSVKIERMLNTPKTWAIAQQFFSISANERGWKIYATETQNHWIVNFKGHYFHLKNRISPYAEFHLDDISEKINLLERMTLPKDHYFRMRAVYFDDKHTNYCWYIDYLYPSGDDPIATGHSIKESLYDCKEFCDGVSHEIDVYCHRYSKGSDHFDKDHYDYYNPYLYEFQSGQNRPEQYFIIDATGKRIYIGDDPVDNSFFNQKFEELVSTFKKIDFINIISSTNSNIEYLDMFSLQIDWDEVVEHFNVEMDSFYSANIIIECEEFGKLERLLKRIPNNVDSFFRLNKRYAFLPDGELDNECSYKLLFSIHPMKIKDKFNGRKLFNTYFEEVIKEVNMYLNEV
ncbi:TPA: restriction endonuclease [Bacillus pseudomycoides]|nr:restriction endonuclease [Bacillus pseudomycoides]